MNSAAPAVLLGGLNVTRALGLGGVPVIVASVQADNPAFASRYCVERLLLPPLADRGDRRRARAALLQQRRLARPGAGLPRRARAVLLAAPERPGGRRRGDRK